MILDVLKQNDARAKGGDHITGPTDCWPRRESSTADSEQAETDDRVLGAEEFRSSGSRGQVWTTKFRGVHISSNVLARVHILNRILLDVGIVGTPLLAPGMDTHG